MSKRDPRIDAYIAKSADFAKPILNHLRRLVHTACPEVEETIKWGSPFFLHEGILVALPAFKRHCALVFWKGRLIFDQAQRARLRHLTSLADLPGDKILLAYLRKAVELNKTGVKTPARAKPRAKKVLVVPGYFLAALRQNKKAQATFENFSPSRQRKCVSGLPKPNRRKRGRAGCKPPCN